MSNCINKSSFCKNLFISLVINFDATTNTVIVDLPAGSYGNNCNYCIVFAQSIPPSATINAQVVFSIGGGTTQYPFVNCDCTPILASQIRTRKKYKTRVSTAVGTGIFKYIGKNCLPSNSITTIQSIPVATSTTTPTPATNTPR